MNVTRGLDPQVSGQQMRGSSPRMTA